MDNGITDQDDYTDQDSNNNLMFSTLPVACLSKHSDLSAPPVTGEEYLARVRLEASKNQTVVAHIDIKKFENKRTANYFQNVN